MLSSNDEVSRFGKMLRMVRPEVANEYIGIKNPFFHPQDFLMGRAARALR